MPCIIKYHCDDATAIKIMSATNDQRTPTDLELAESYRMYMESQEIVSKKGQRTDLAKKTDGKSSKDVISEIAEQQNKSESTVRRYLNVSKLIPDLKDKIADKTLSVSAGSEFGTLSEKDQKIILSALTYYGVSPTTPEAQKIHELAKAKEKDNKNITFTQIKCVIVDDFKKLAPEWQKLYEEKRFNDTTAVRLAALSAINQKTIYSISTELKKLPTLNQIELFQKKEANHDLTVDFIKSTLDPTYVKPVVQGARNQEPEKPTDPSFSVKTSVSTPSAPAPQTPPTQIPPSAPSASAEKTEIQHQSPAGTTIQPPAPIAAPVPEPPAPKEEGIFLPADKLKAYFPKSYSLEKIKDSVYKLLDAWHKKQEQKKAVSR